MADLQLDFKAVDELEALLGGGVDWVDDVSGYECARCKKVLVQHYISNCDHKFCANCKRVVDDGSQRWRCPECREFIKNMDRQDFDFRDRVRQLRVHCLNSKYGCPHVCTLKELKEHVRECEQTKERALPALYKGTLSTEMLEQMSMLRESNAELRQKMMEMEKKRYEDKVEVVTTLRNIESRLDGVNLQTNRLSNEIQGLKNLDISSSVEENKAKILKLEHKSEFWFEILDLKEKSLSDLISKTKKDLQRDLQILTLQTENYVEKSSGLEIKIEKEMASMKKETSSKIEILKRDFDEQKKKCWDETENCKAKIEKVNEKTEKIKLEMETQIRNVKAEIEGQLTKQNAKCEELGKAMMGEVPKETDQISSTLERRFRDALQLKTSIFQTKPQMTQFNLCERNINIQPDFIWKIKRIKELMKRETFEVKSEMFAWNGYPIKAQTQLKLKRNDQVYVSLNLKECHVGKTMDIKLIPNVYFVLRDQSNNTPTKHMCISMSYPFDATFDSSFSIMTPIAQKSSFTNNFYNVNDSVLIEIYVEPPSLAQTVYSYDGTLNWSIDHYRERKRMEKEELVWWQESPYFYTGSRGYRVRVDVYLDGWGNHKGKGLSVRIVFLSGEFDEELDKSFPHKTTVTLLNRKDSERNITKQVDKNIEDYIYFLDVCSDGEIDCLLENDTLFYSIMIKAIE